MITEDIQLEFYEDALRMRQVRITRHKIQVRLTRDDWKKHLVAFYERYEYGQTMPPLHVIEQEAALNWWMSQVYGL